MINAETRLIGLIGHPVRHSLSPLFQNRALEALQLPFVYLAFDVLSENLGKVVETFRILNVRGFNVTIPHKERICSFLEHLEEEAKVVQAVNTVVNDGSALIGYNTDIYGLEKSMEEKEVNLEGKNILLLGAGGVSKAVVFVLSKKRIKSLIISNRTPHRAQELSHFAQRFFSLPVKVLFWEDALRGKGSLLERVEVIVNTTSLGLGGENIPLNWQRFSSCSCVIDVAYRREGETPLVVEARKRGIYGFSGKSMLLHQGARSFELFTGHPAPLEVMKRSLEKEGEDSP
ncbi:MAG: shikimate dehydrogenase [Candidatus Caldatribacteriaceae bacterium]